MLKDIASMQKAGYSYTFAFIVNIVAFALVYKLFGFEVLIVVALADITRDLGIIAVRQFKEAKN